MTGPGQDEDEYYVELAGTVCVKQRNPEIERREGARFGLDLTKMVETPKWLIEWAKKCK